jgi:hypothetical protein
VHHHVKPWDRSERYDVYQSTRRGARGSSRAYDDTEETLDPLERVLNRFGASFLIGKRRRA